MEQRNKFVLPVPWTLPQLEWVVFSGGQPEPRASLDLRGLLDLLSDHICLDQRPVPPESVQWPLMEARQDSSFHQRKSALRYDKSEPADSTRWLQRRPWEAEATNRGGRTEGSSAHRTTVRQGPGTRNSRCPSGLARRSFDSEYSTLPPSYR